MSLRIDAERHIELLVSSDASRMKIAGGPGTGKTLLLTRRARALVASGTQAGKVLVVTATPSAAAEFRKGLGDTFGDIVVTTPHDLWVMILSAPDAVAATGRTPRILNSAEYKFLLEDMKVLGMKAGRMREMLGYFYRGWSEMRDGSEKFILGPEEETVAGALKSHLVRRKAMLAEELANSAVHYLRGLDETGLAVLRFEHVLVDDYQNLSKASQIALGMLAEKSLWAAGNENQVAETLDLYPFSEGFTNFAENNDGAEEVELTFSLRCSQSVAAAANRLALDDSMARDRIVEFDDETPEGAVKLAKWMTPAAEFDGIVKYVKKRVSSADDPLKESDILIVVPNKTWGQSLAAVLDDEQIKHADLLAGQAISGDPREPKKSRALRAYTALNLVANPADVVAWRSWCGFDSYLCNSLAWAGLTAFAEQNGCDLIGALESISHLDEPAFLDAEKLVSAYMAGKALIEANKDKQGFALLNSIDERMPVVIESLLSPIVGDEDAATLYARLAERNLNPRFDIRNHGVRIGTPESTCGLDAKLVILCGLIDGFVPSPDVFDLNVYHTKQDEIRDRERVRFYSALAKASDEVVLSYFQKADLAIAEPLKMEVRRIVSEQGERVARLSPSMFLDELGDAVPGVAAVL